MTWFQNHFARLEQLPPGRYLWRVAVETFALSMAVALLGAAIGMKSRDVPDMAALVLTAVLVAPWLETALFQWLPIAISRRLGARRQTQIGVSVVAFALPHFAVAGLTGVSAGLVGGFYFAFTYTAWRTRSAARAYWMTTAHHGLYNTLIVIAAGVASLFD